MKTSKEIEELEKKYLNKYYHFLKFAEDEMLSGFKTKDDIKDDWWGLYSSGISDFSTGAERIVYSLLNGKGIGQPNSSPVGSDLFFEVDDAYIHIDLKTVGASLKGNSNIGDYTRSIFVGTNQNSYSGEMIVKGERRSYSPQLPTYYNKGKQNEKICLSYFITILYDSDNLDTLVMCIVCMPNGELEPVYKTDVLSAGKNIEKTRFRFTNTPKFRLLGKNDYRIKVVVFKDDMNEVYKKKVSFFQEIHSKQSINDN
jgi:hypothetical protein|tara:strand:- start:32 stop:799 length:768 start_codon:yes stop_codon:yes gene_type:complete